MKLRAVLPAVIGLGVVAALAACGPNAAVEKASGAGGGAAAPAPAATTAAPAPAGPVKVITVSTVDGLAPIVTTDKGRTIYRFDSDSANPSKTTCVGQCAVTWEPVLVPNGFEIKGDGIDKSLVGEIVRPEGDKQMTLKGWPLYYFKDDKTLGQLVGQARAAPGSPSPRTAPRPRRPPRAAARPAVPAARTPVAGATATESLPEMGGGRGVATAHRCFPAARLTVKIDTHNIDVYKSVRLTNLPWANLPARCFRARPEVCKEEKPP